MATINNKLIHFKSKSDFNSRYKETTNDGNTYGDFLGTSIVFIQDAKQIWTHGQFYDANEATLASLGITATAEELNKLDGVTATTQELNYIDGVTSNIQTQLDNKAALSHTHTTSQVSGLSEVATSGSYNDLSDKPAIPSLSDYATQSWVEEQGYLTSVSWTDVSEKPSTFTPAAHTHGTDNITALTGYTEGSSTTTLSSSMNLNEALASLQNQVQDKISSSSLDDYALKTEIPDTSNLATKTELAGYLPLTGGTLTGSLEFNIQGGGGAIMATDAGVVLMSTGTVGLMAGGTGLQINSSGDVLIGEDKILTEANWNEYITVTDAKNTTGTSNWVGKMYLVGGLSQSVEGVVTFSNKSVYTQSGQLYATQMNSTNGFFETSDARLKNFKDDIKALDVVSKIPTKYFTWKKDENSDPKLHIGTSAQEIQKLYPDLVSENEEGELLVDYARLSVIALAAIKELKEEINELKTKLS